MSRVLEVALFMGLLSILIGFMWYAAYQDRACSMTEMYRSMGHASIERDGLWVTSDGKQERCRYIFFEHGPGRIIGGIDRCHEGHLVISISIPKGESQSE